MLALVLAVATANYVPPPHPCPSDLVVGSYYFPGFFSPVRWLPFKRCGYPTPLLGFYRGGEPEVLDWQIKWAVEHGISFFAFDWYGGPAGANLTADSALDHGFLHARYRNLMKFCLMWCNEGHDERYTEDDMVKLARLFTKRYFSQPNYLKVGGDNLLIVSVPAHLLASFGAQGTARVFRRMAEISRAAGCGGLFPVAKQQDDQAALKAAGFRATTAYNYPEAGMTQEQKWAGRAPYSSMVGGYEKEWKQATAPGNLPYIVPVAPGWDSRPWYFDSALVRTNPRPRLFYQMCMAARRYVDLKLRMVIAECWNEFGEGSYVEPTEQTGFGYLDAMRDAFCPDNPDHVDVTPRGLGLPVPAYSYDDLPRASATELLAMGENMLYNGGFEHPWGWEDYDGSPAKLSAEAHSGAKALSVTPAEGVKSDWVMPVPASRRVRLKLWAWVPEGASLKVLAALFRGSTWLGRYAPLAEAKPTGDEWRALDVTIKIDDPDATGFDVEFVAAGAGCRVDDVEVYGIRGAARKPKLPKTKSAAERMADGENMLYNGDMEADWGWVSFDDKTPAPFTTDAHAGKRGLTVPRDKGVKTQWLMPLPPSRGVRLELWAKVPAGATLSVSCALLRNGVWLGDYARALQATGTDGKWHRYGGRLTAVDPLASEFDVEFVAHGAACQVDDVSVHAVEQ